MNADFQVWAGLVGLANQMGVRLAYKDRSWFMRALGWLLFFNPSFMEKFSTTIGRTVYFPTAAWVEANQFQAAVVLAHELQHVADNRALGSIRYVWRYAWPRGRAWVEYRGYAVTLACLVWAGREIYVPPDWVVVNFTGPNYLYMDRDERRVHAILADWLTKAQNGQILEELPLTALLKPIFQAG